MNFGFLFYSAPRQLEIMGWDMKGGGARCYRCALENEHYWYTHPRMGRTSWYINVVEALA